MGKLYECILYILSFYFPGNRKVFPGFPGNKASGNTATLTNIHFNGVLIIYTKYYTCLFVSSQLIEETSHFSHSRGTNCRVEANNYSKAIVVCARNVVKRPSKRSALVVKK